jgi:hypothetical protein
MAVCDTDEWCPPIPVKPEDRQVFRADARHLCDGIARAVGLARPTARKSTRARAERVGIYEAANAEVFLMIPADSAWMAREVERLFGDQPDPFMLLTPTGIHCSAEVESMLRRQGSIHIPLARFISLCDHGKLTASHALKPLLAAFTRQAQAALPLRTGERAGVRCPPDQSTISQRPSPKYALRKGRGAWTLIFNGQEAPLKHEKGILYVAWLLTNPDKVPIHAIDLAAQVPAIYRQQLGITSAVDDTTGKAVPLAATARPQERSHGLDDLEAARRLHRKQQELEAVLDDDDATEPEKAEALAELERVYEFQKKHAMRSKGNAENLVRAVRAAITRFHKHLAAATDGNGQPHPVLRPFADHLARHLITPSARFTGRAGSRVRAGVAGRFTYEPPAGVQWTC